MSKRIGILAIGCVAMLGIAVAQDDADEATGVPEGDAAPELEQACFSVRQSQNMSALDDRFVYLRNSGSRHFLLSMGGNCPGLRGARGITVQNRGRDRVCSGDAASIAYRPNGAGPARTCSIREVNAVESRAAAEELVETLTAR